MASQTVRLWLPPGRELTANGRYHWAERARRSRRIRWSAGLEARLAGLRPVPGPVAVTVTVTYPRRGRRDPENYAPSWKPAIDGLVDAGVLPDDDSTHVVQVACRADPQTVREVCGRPSGHLLTITLIPEGEAS